MSFSLIGYSSVLILCRCCELQKSLRKQLQGKNTFRAWPYYQSWYLVSFYFGSITSSFSFLLLYMWTSSTHTSFWWQRFIWQQFLRTNTINTRWSWASSHLVCYHQTPEASLFFHTIFFSLFVDLRYALIFRNLSRNYLNGPLPAEFGNLRSIQIM